MSLAARYVLKSLERLSVGRLTVKLPDGKVRMFGNADATPRAEIEVRDWRLFRKVLLDGDMGFAEGYMEGFCDSPDLPALIHLLLANEKELGKIARTNVFHDLILKFLHRGTRIRERDRRRTSMPTTTWATTSMACGSILR